MIRRLGIDVGGTKCLGVVLDQSGAVTEEVRVATPHGVDALVDSLVHVVERLGGGDTIGVGLPGLVDDDGVLRAAPNLPGVFDFPAARRLSDRLDRPVAVYNDATCATLAEWRAGAGRGVDDLILVTLGTGIGGGMVAGGRLVSGGHGLAGEIGHMTVDLDGRPCGCGRRGCWERYASGSALGDHAMVLTGSRASGEQVVAAARQGESWARQVIDVFAMWVAVGLANLANAVDPSRIVLGGGLAEAGDVLLEPIRAAFPRRLYAPDHRPVPPIVMAELGPTGGAIGAALWASDRP